MTFGDVFAKLLAEERGGVRCVITIVPLCVSMCFYVVGPHGGYFPLFLQVVGSPGAVSLCFCMGCMILF